MSCDTTGTNLSKNLANLSDEKERSELLLDFAAWDIENLWQNCKALGYSDAEIRSAVSELVLKIANRNRSKLAATKVTLSNQE